MSNVSIIYEIYENIKQLENINYKNNENFKKQNEDLLKLIDETCKFTNFIDFIDKDSIKAYAYLNLGKYEEAINIYKEEKRYDKIGDIYYNLFNNYNNKALNLNNNDAEIYMEKACENYNKCSFHLKVIKCLIQIKNYKKLFIYLNECFGE